MIDVFALVGLVLFGVIFFRLLGRNKNQLVEQIERKLDSVSGVFEKVQGVVAELEKGQALKFNDVSSLIQYTNEQTKALVATTQDLAKVLSNSQMRGQWGEKLAEDVLRAIGFTETIHYLKQKTLPDGKRPDFTFLLPGAKTLHMDVKFPVKNYQEFLDARTKSEQDQFKKLFLVDVRTAVRSLIERGYTSEDTVGCVLLFIPNDQVLSFIQIHGSEVFDEAMEKHVILSSPTTLLAVLSVVRKAMDHFTLQQTAQTLLSELLEFRKQWQMFAKSFDSLGKKISDTQAEFEKLSTTRTRQLEASLERLSQIKNSSAMDL